MSFLLTLKTIASGIYAQRKRMDVIAGNITNIETTRSEDGRPYRRKIVVMSTRHPEKDFNNIFNSHLEGVEIEGITEDQNPFKRVFSPSHPHADSNGYLEKPNVDLVVETTNMLMAKRAFEANIAAIKATRQMILKTLEIGR